MEAFGDDKRGVEYFLVFEGTSNADIFRLKKHVCGEHFLGRIAVNNLVKSFIQFRHIIKDALKPGQVHAAVNDSSVARCRCDS